MSKTFLVTKYVITFIRDTRTYYLRNGNTPTQHVRLATLFDSSEKAKEFCDFLVMHRHPGITDIKLIKVQVIVLLNHENN